VARVLSSHYPFYDLLLTTGACLSTAQAVLHDKRLVIERVVECNECGAVFSFAGWSRGSSWRWLPMDLPSNNLAVPRKLKPCVEHVLRVLGPDALLLQGVDDEVAGLEAPLLRRIGEAYLTVPQLKVPRPS
jgi:hypothetical protein